METQSSEADRGHRATGKDAIVKGGTRQEATREGGAHSGREDKMEEEEVEASGRCRALRGDRRVNGRTGWSVPREPRQGEVKLEESSWGLCKGEGQWSRPKGWAAASGSCHFLLLGKLAGWEGEDVVFRIRDFHMLGG